MIQTRFMLLCGTSFFPMVFQTVMAENQKMNVLLIMADDMRPELGCYGVKEVKTPHIDRLASSGVLFQNAYCNVPVSGASRASLLTGVYPHYPERFVHYSAYASKDCPQAIPVSQWFTSHGYHTISDGKVFHHISDHADSWSEPPYRNHPDGYDVYWAEYNRWELWMNDASARSINPKTKRGPFCESADVPDNAYDDGKLAERVVQDLRRLKEKGKPFFWPVAFGNRIFRLMRLRSTGIYMIEMKFRCQRTVFVLKDCRQRSGILRKSMLMRGLLCLMIFIFRRKRNMVIMLV